MSRHVLLALASAALVGATTLAAHAAPAVSNGGAQYWVAFDPNGRDVGSVFFASKRFFIVNTSNQPNAYTIYDEPSHKTICSGTLGPGQMDTCGTQQGPVEYNNYFQVIAAQPVLVGGTSDTAFLNYTQQGGAPAQADTAHGMIIGVPLTWQQGCPPRPGDGCPDGRIAVDPNGGAIGRVQPQPFNH
jgi:hypothetical protein